jgi:hypothetical protein
MHGALRREAGAPCPCSETREVQGLASVDARIWGITSNGVKPSAGSFRQEYSTRTSPEQIQAQD